MKDLSSWTKKYNRKLWRNIMIIDIPNLDELVKTYNMREVTSATLFSQNSIEPDPDGLASYEIFGKPGSEDRKNTFAYINLNSFFIHPQVFSALERLKRETFKDLVSGAMEFYVENGELKPIKPGNKAPAGVSHGTGLVWLYKIWDQLNFKPKKDDAQTTKDRKKLICSLKKNEIFITKWLVMPPFYRDVDLHTNRRNKWNTYYIKLIQLASMIRGASIMMDIYQTTDAHRKIQETLGEMYEEILKFIGGTKGFIHNSVMGKPTKYSCRLVISSSNYDADKEEELDASFDHSPTPLHAVIKIFRPFISYRLKVILETYLAGRRYMVSNPFVKNSERKELDPNYMDLANMKTLDKIINLYEESKYHRLMPVTLKARDGTPIYPFWFNANNEEENNIAVASDDFNIASDAENQVLEIQAESEGKKFIKPDWRPLNWCQLFYMCAYDTVRDKVIYITRYPIEDHNNIYPSLMSIIPCTNTRRTKMLDFIYPKFPILPKIEDVKENELDHFFIDTLNLHPAYLKSLNADFDGDMVSVISVFTEEANASAKKFIKSITNMGSINGSTMRIVSDITAQTVYNITMRV